MSWVAALRPASFAGVGFWVHTQKAKAGQRLVVREVPYSTPDLENTGKLPKQFTVTAYFLGDAWMLQRLALLTALDNASTAQTLVLPTVGPVTVMVGQVSYGDDEQVGNYGAVEFDCVVYSATTAPFANADTASTLLNNVAAMAAQIASAYDAAMAPLVQAAAVADYAAALLGSAASAVLALPLAVIDGVATAFAAAPTDTLGTAGGVTQAFLTISDNAAAQINPEAVTVTPVSGAVPLSALPADPSLGLAALAGWGGDLAAPALYPASLAVAQGAVVALVQQSAGLAMAALYAQTVFPDRQAANAARAQMAAMINVIAATIANAGQPDMYRAWLALGTLAINDMRARAQNLPNLVQYEFNASLPDVVLAATLQGDGAQGDALALLNNAIHPLFMPPSGVWLAAA